MHLPENVTLGVADERLGKRLKQRSKKFWPNLSSAFPPLPLPRAGATFNPRSSLLGAPGTHPASRGGRPSQELSQLRSISKRLPRRPIRGTAARGQLPRPRCAADTQAPESKPRSGSRSQVSVPGEGRALPVCGASHNAPLRQAAATAAAL